MSLEDRIYQVNRIVANLFVLYIKLHRYRWYVQSEQTITLVNWFDKVLNECKHHIDQLVETILILDGQPFATMTKYVKEATLEEATSDNETEEMMEQLINDTTKVLLEIDELIEKCTDEQTERIMIQTLQSLEYWLMDIRHKCKKFLK